MTTVTECAGVSEVGYSIMLDGSHLRVEENLKLAKDVVEKAHAKGISVEAEVAIGGEEDGIIGKGGWLQSKTLKQWFATNGIDFLAAGIINIHGHTQQTGKVLTLTT